MTTNPKERRTARQQAALDRLAEIVRLIHAAKRSLYRAVRDARNAGSSWAEVAQYLGVSTAAAHQRFRDPPKRKRL